jgi:predicted ester cyclase
MDNHKKIVHRLYESIRNQTDKDVIPLLVHSDVRFRGSLGEVQRGLEKFSGYLDFVREALDHYCCDIIDMVAEGDRVYARIQYSGVHRGEFFGFAPTYAKLRWEGIAAFTFAEGKIAELWAIGDMQAVLRQLARHVE